MGYPTNIHKIEKSNLVDNVIQQMYGLIEGGAWKEGSKLASENQLATEFNVSRVVIREALQNLRSRNMIITRQGLGSFVCNPMNFTNHLKEGNLLEISEDDFLSLSELRMCVESRAVELSVIHGTQSDFERIHNALKHMEESADHLDEYTIADYEFHLAIVESGHSELLIKAYHSCRNELLFILRELNRLNHSQTYGIASHAEVYEAIRARDAKGALAIFKNMVKFNTVRYASLFKHSE